MEITELRKQELEESARVLAQTKYNGDTYICKKCKRALPINAFRNTKAISTGHDSTCGVCRDLDKKLFKGQKVSQNASKATKIKKDTSGAKGRYIGENN